MTDKMDQQLTGNQGTGAVKPSRNVRLIKASHLIYGALILYSLISAACLIFLVWPFSFIPAGLIVGVIFMAYVIKYPMIGLATYIFIFLFKPQVLLGMEAFPIERSVFLVLGLAMAIHVTFIQKKLRLGYLEWAYLAFVLAAFLSIVGAEDLFRARFQFEKILEVFLAVYFMTRVAGSEKKIKIILWIYVAAMGYTAFFSTMNYYGGEFQSRMGIQRAYSTLGSHADPNSMAASLILAMPFIVAMLKSYRQVWIKVFCLGTMALCIWTVIISGSRSGMLATMLAIGLIAWHSRFRVRALVAALIVLVAAAAVMPAQYVERFATIFEYDVEDTTGAAESAQGRIDGLIMGGRLLMERPLTGVGIANFGLANHMHGGPYLDAHNLIGKLIGEMGLIGIAAWLFFMFRFVKSLKVARSMLSRLNISSGFVYQFREAIIISLILLFFQGIFGHNLFRYNWYYFACWAVILVGILSAKEKAAALPAEGNPGQGRPVVRGSDPPALEGATG